MQPWGWNGQRVTVPEDDRTMEAALLTAEATLRRALTWNLPAYQKRELAEALAETRKALGLPTRSDER